MFSIDQNCHPLWDVVPKLHALARRGLEVNHYVEDIDVAFTSLGSTPDDAALRLGPERFHPSGGADWGAALFYSEFLGRLPVDVRDFEPFIGMKISVLAKQLGESIDHLYDEFSSSDNWQLMGSSYVGDRHHHRIIADLTVAETRDFLREVAKRAKADMLRAFPDKDSQQRLSRWFGRLESQLDELIRAHADDALVDLYHNWLRSCVPDSVRIRRASSLFPVDSSSPPDPFLQLFLDDYETAADLYNQSVAETPTDLRPLRLADGEMPFFATLSHEGHSVRTPVFFNNGAIRVGRDSFQLVSGEFPRDAMAAAGVRCIVGKAVVLVLQVSLGPGNGPLAVPYRGSVYLPAASAFAKRLTERGLLPGELKPLLRVRLRLLDRLKSLQATIRLPRHLASCFGVDEIPACQLGESYADIAAEAAERLEGFKDEAFRRKWQRQNLPQLVGEIDELDKRRRELAQTGPDPAEIRGVWKQLKARQNELLAATLRRIADDYQLREIEYWDSRGAIWPWCVALGGEKFYDELIANAEFYEEPLN